MNLITKRKIIYVDSGSQLTSTNNVFTANLDVDIPPDYNYCSLVGFQCPVSYYVIYSINNTFQLKEGNTTVTISLPVGNYNIYSFADTVQALLTANSPNGYTYSVVYPSSFNTVDTGKFTYTVSSIAKMVSFIFPANNSVSDLFGFPAGTTDTFVITGSSQTLVSLNVVSFVPESSLFLHMSCIDGECQSVYNDVLQVIYSSNAQPYSVIAWTNPQILETSKRLRGNVGRILQFSITDERGYPIYLNGQNCLLTILFFSFPEPKPESDSLITKYIYMRTNVLESETQKNDRMIQLKEEQIEQNKRIIALLEQQISNNNLTSLNKENGEEAQKNIGGEFPLNLP